MSCSGAGTSSDDGDMVVPHLDSKASQRRSALRSDATGGLAVLSSSAAAAGNPAAPLHMGMLDTILRTEWDDRKQQGLFRCLLVDIMLLYQAFTSSMEVLLQAARRVMHRVCASLFASLLMYMLL